MIEQIAQIVAAGGTVGFRPVGNGELGIHVEIYGSRNSLACPGTNAAMKECMQYLFEWFIALQKAYTVMTG